MHQSFKNWLIPGPLSYYEFRPCPNSSVTWFAEFSIFYTMTIYDQINLIRYFFQNWTS